MSVQYEVYRGPRGGTITKVDQVAALSDVDHVLEPGKYDYAIKPVNTTTGSTGNLTDRVEQDVPWAPDFVEDSLTALLDAGRTGVETTISTTNGNVDTWHDASPAGNDATQSTGGDRPAHGNVTQNGEPVVSFESGESLDLSISQPASYVLGLVFKQGATGTTDIITGDVSVGKSSGSWSAGGVTGGTADTNWHVLNLSVSAGNARLRVDGNDLGVTTNGTSLSSLSIGGAQLDVAELALTDGLVSIERMEGYLAHEWGLASNLDTHRFESEQPFQHEPYIYPDPWHSTTEREAWQFEKEVFGLPSDPVFFLSPGSKIPIIDLN
jgi:hypothetical protein